MLPYAPYSASRPWNFLRSHTPNNLRASDHSNRLVISTTMPRCTKRGRFWHRRTEIGGFWSASVREALTYRKGTAGRTEGTHGKRHLVKSQSILEQKGLECTNCRNPGKLGVLSDLGFCWGRPLGRSLMRPWQGKRPYTRSVLGACGRKRLPDGASTSQGWPSRPRPYRQRIVAATFGTPARPQQSIAIPRRQHINLLCIWRIWEEPVPFNRKIKIIY